jgi:Spy/CpxP family protein refolding chaperone
MARTYSFAVLWGSAGLIAAGLLMGQGFSPRRFEYRFGKIATYLNLSADQQARAKTIIGDALKEAQPLIAELKQNHQEMQQLIKSGDSPQFDQQVQRLAAGQGSLVSKLVVIHARTMAQVRALLTPEQIQKADQLRELMMPWPGVAAGMMRTPAM